MCCTQWRETKGRHKGVGGREKARLGYRYGGMTGRRNSTLAKDYGMKRPCDPPGGVISDNVQCVCDGREEQ